MNRAPSEKYEQARAVYLKALAEYKKVKAETQSMSLRAQNIDDEIRNLDHKIKGLEAHLLEIVGSGNEREVMNEIRETQLQAADAKMIQGLMISHQYDPRKNHFPYTQKVELLGDATRVFFDQVIREEMMNLPGGFMDVLLRAYSVFAGSDPDRWDRFFAVYFDLTVPGHLKGEWLMNLRREVLQSHGAEVA